tara:strand:- start:616 stop:1095 length:480 start_codon:yes stop_codon:yes gene_type:complete
MPTVSLEPVTYADAAYVSRRLRKWDEKEIMPLLRGGPEDLAMLSASSNYGRVALCDGVPVAVFGATETKPTIWQVFMFATDKWPKVALTVTRHIKKVMIPILYDAGANRAECRSHSEYIWAHKWLKCLGAKQESVLPEYGPKRETYVSYVWLRSQYKVN